MISGRIKADGGESTGEIKSDGGGSTGRIKSDGGRIKSDGGESTGRIKSDGGESAGADFKSANKAEDGVMYAEVVVTSAGKIRQTMDNAVPYEMVDLTASRVSH